MWPQGPGHDTYIYQTGFAEALASPIYEFSDIFRNKLHPYLYIASKFKMTEQLSTVSHMRGKIVDLHVI